jgi:general secretion pathway protein L
MVPQRLQQWWRGADGVVLLTFNENHAIFEKPVAGQLKKILSVDTRDPVDAQPLQVGRQLTNAAGKSFRLMLRVPAITVLRRTLTLPLVVEENLRQTLAFELDRYTPFKSDQVYFDFRLLGRDAIQRRIKVELAVVQRSVVDREANRAAALGLSATGAILAEQTLSDDCYNFLPAVPGSGKLTSSTWWRASLALLAILLLAVLLFVPVWQKRATAISLLEPLAQAKAAAQQTDALRDRLDKLVREHSFLLDMKWGSPSIVLVVEEISKRLPDDTFIIQFEFDGKTVQLQGESAAASGLVEILENSPMLKDVGFKAQLTKIQGTPNDRFHIVALLEEQARPKPDAIAVEGMASGSAAPVATVQPTSAGKP